jgi:hypothetical protein
MRAYFLTNFYLSPIQHGIQSAHALAEMSVHYFSAFQDDPDTYAPYYDTYVDWVTNHKTIIVLNGGMNKDMEDFYDYLWHVKPVDNPWIPWGVFYEPELRETLTAIALILPELHCQALDQHREQGQQSLQYMSFFQYTNLLSPWEMGLLDMLSKKGLAR